jgi:hypothetical protein
VFENIGRNLDVDADYHHHKLGEINFNLLEITLRILFLTYHRYYGCLSQMKKR